MLKRVIVRTMLFALLGGSLLVWSAPKAEGWASTCDNCYLGTNKAGDPDAQCCLDGFCGMLQQNGYYRIESGMDYCTSWQHLDSQGEVDYAGCEGNANTCTSGGGGGGGTPGDCSVGIGEVCPAECMSCTFYWY